MSTWQMFSDSGNTFRWEMSDQELQKDQQFDVVPQQDLDSHRLPSMADLLFLGCSEILETNCNTEGIPLFRTGLGKSVAVKQSSIEKACLILSDVDDLPTGAGHLYEGESGHPSSKPVFEMGSFKSTAMPRSGSQNRPERAVNISNSMFQTGSGKKVNISSAGLRRAKALLGLDVNSDKESPAVVEQTQNQLSCMKLLAWENPSHLENGETFNRSESTDTISISMFQTGSGKKVNISSAGFSRAKALLGLDVNSDQESPTMYEQAENQSSSTKFLAFENPSHMENGDTCYRSESAANISNSMFQTGSGKNVNISSAGFSRAKALLGLDVNSDQESPTVFEQTQNQSYSTKPSPIKFQTAGGRSISVSREALQRARSLLGNLDSNSCLSDESTAVAVFPVTADEKPSCPDHNRDFSTPFMQKGTENDKSSSRNFTSPLRSYSCQKSQKLLGKFQKIQPGNNLMTKFDAEATANTSEVPYGLLTWDTKSLKENYSLGKLDCLGTTIQPKTDPSKKPVNGTLVDISNTMDMDNTDNKQCLGEKRRPGRIKSASPFKKPRSLFVTPLNKNNSLVNNDLSRFAPKESCCKRVSTRYPLQVPRKYLTEYVSQPPLQEKLENLPEHVKRMNPLAAESHIFENGTPSDGIGMEAFLRMLSLSGASIQYLTKEWVSNHYKWIVWKLASYERCYPTRFSGKLLTVYNVLEELRYRYEREVNHGHRSAIKKILDGDAPPSSTMVLCISSIDVNREPKFGHQCALPETNGYDKASKIELTDGWYSVKALLDESLSQKLAAGKLFLGQKLKISGAKLCGWLGPISPLETSRPSLMLHINGTYRCHWAEKLGFCKSAGVPLAFRCIKGNGGLIPSTLVGVTRIYPILYGERLSDASFVVRSERMEAKALQLYNQRCDVIAEEITAAFQRETDVDVDFDNDHESEEGAKIMKLLETAAEPEVLMAGMSSKQLTSFASYKAKLEALKQSKMQKSIEKAIEAAGLNKREVTPFMRVKVVGLTNRSHPQEGCPRKGLITIWNPTQKQILELCEGQAYAVGGLSPSSTDSGILYLQARGSTSNWLPLSPSIMRKYKPFFVPHSATTISNLGEVPISSEFDIAAFIVYVGEVYTQGHQQKQWVFVTDGSITESCGNISQDALLAINFCLPCAEVYTCAPVNSNIAGSVAGFRNLTKRARDEANGLWVAEATENSEYFLSYDATSRRHLKETAAVVLNWASTSSSITEKLGNSVLSIIQRSKEGH